MFNKDNIISSYTYYIHIVTIKLKDFNKFMWLQAIKNCLFSRRNYKVNIRTLLINF